MYLSLAEHWTRNVNSLDKIKGANLSDVARAVHIYICHRATYRSRNKRVDDHIYCLSNQSIFSCIFLYSLNVVFTDILFCQIPRDLNNMLHQRTKNFSNSAFDSPNSTSVYTFLVS